VFEQASVLPAVGPSGLAVLGWKDSETLYISDLSVRFGYFAIVVGTGAFDPEPVSPDEIVVLHPPLREEVTNRYEQPFPLGPTADGSGWIVTFRGPVEGFAVVVGDNALTVEQPHGGSIGLRGVMDVVIVR